MNGVVDSGRSKDPSFSKMMLVMDIVDGLRQEEGQRQQFLQDAQEERDVVERVKTTYAAQGMEVSDAQVREAVSIWRTRRYAFTPLTEGWRHSLAQWYVSRSKWLSRARATGLGVLASLGLVGTGTLGLDAWQGKTWEAEIEQIQEDYRSQRTRLYRENEVFEQAGAWGLSQGTASTQQAWLVWGDSLARAHHEESRTKDAVDALTTAERGEGKPSAENGVRQLDGTLDDVEKWRRQAERYRGDAVALADLAAKVQEAEVSWPGSSEQLRAVNAALLEKDIQAATAAWSRVQALRSAQDEKANWRQRLDGWTDATARTQGEGLWSNLVAGLESENQEQVSSALASLTDLGNRLNQAYVLRIVQSPNERSGVWRVEEGNASARRNYYIVVDSVDAMRNLVPLSIRNEETGRNERVSRFAVRVPESEYELVRQDKQDNGIVDRAQFGSKDAGVLEPVYHYKIAGGMITDWD